MAFNVLFLDLDGVYTGVHFVILVCVLFCKFDLFHSKKRIKRKKEYGTLVITAFKQ